MGVEVSDRAQGPGWCLASDGKWYPPQPPVIPVRPKTNGLAIASMVLGIVWIYWIGSILAIVFGHVALSQIKKSGGTQGGRGMAIAGLVLGYLSIGLSVLFFAWLAMYCSNQPGGICTVN